MKKKIGILTQPLVNNYGGILQAYALTAVLSEMGHNVEVIDRKVDAYNDRYLKKRLKFLIKKYILKRKNPDTLRIQQAISENTLKFVKDNIPISNVAYFSSNIMDINNKEFDAIIVGSDQVWRPIYSPCITNYFLDFCQSENFKKIAYSASFGCDNWEFTQKDTEVCAHLAKKFDAIAVREDSAIKLCQDYLGVNAEHTLDPTLLLDKQHYIDLITKYNEPESAGKLMCYVLDKSGEKQAIINYFSDTLLLKTFHVMPIKTLDEKYNKNAHSDFEYPPLTKWLKGFMDAEFVITDSFHGCVFSIIFNKPFVAIANKDRGLARFYSLLKAFELNTRLIFNMNDINSELLSYEFNWKRINMLVEQKKMFSIKFLEDSLK